MLARVYVGTCHVSFCLTIFETYTAYGFSGMKFYQLGTNVGTY